MSSGVFRNITNFTYIQKYTIKHRHSRKTDYDRTSSRAMTQKIPLLKYDVIIRPHPTRNVIHQLEGFQRSDFNQKSFSVTYKT